MTGDAIRTLRASTTVAAPPAAVWQVVSDVRRTGEWSPECVGVTPLGRVRRGTLLFGRNRHGLARWVTLSRVTDYDVDRMIAWRVLTNRAVWSYTLEPAADGGTRLVQERRTPRGVGRFASWFTRTFLGGQTGHDAELEAGMASGLAVIADLAVAPSPVLR